MASTEDLARELLAALWGAPKEPTPQFLAVLQSVLDRHAASILQAEPESPPTQPTAVVYQEEDNHDDVSTLLQWIDQGEWLR